MLISVHIPKTGGSSFKGILEAHFGNRIMLDFDDKPMARGNLVRNFQAVLGMARGNRNSKQYECVHGHFLPIKYSLLKNREFVVWLRDPAERIISRYYHFKRNRRPSGPQFKKYIKNADLDLEQFVRIEHYQNTYHKYLFGMKLEDFGFIGITEKYDSSLGVFARKYGIQLPESYGIRNVNPLKKSGKYEVDDELRKLIYRLNYRDFDIYSRALEINEEMAVTYVQEL